ncbi:YqiA/YcfP family alpha/beta fold hydrolase [Marinobacterium arenosum]|uniref:YqiA/YcfP family alpha/beta fold hydrolase n=1 Tax=Marinobacterium arenosum TaxID=2862496 RepID=UPI001C95CA0E|nr:YqiA/YcfP family alpha/beta fold hydrolase [Marinobacterium arenosum]MBY4676162.1 alpha/beta fold hydrolase [Marinobacterium arenosum]
MKTPLFIYVHGFNSSPASFKAQLFRRYMAALGREDQVLVPELSHWPSQAMQTLEALVKQNFDRPVVLIGSSLGGYYSTWLTERYVHVRSVLVNPAVAPYRLLEDLLGDNQNLYTHEKYQLTREHLSQLIVLDCDEILRPEAYLLLTQTEDETLDYMEAVQKYAASPQFVQPGGSHGFEQFDKLIPAILAFADGRIELPEVTPVASPLSS